MHFLKLAVNIAAICKTMKVKTTTRFIAEKEYEAINESGNIVKIDMYPPQEKKAQSPTQLLLSAVASCSAVDVVQILTKKRKTVKSLSIETEGIRRENHPRAFTHIHLHFILTSPDTEEADFEKVVHLSVHKYCSVAASLSDSIALKHTVEIIRE